MPEPEEPENITAENITAENITAENITAENITAAQLGEHARAALGALATRTDLAAFQELLSLSQYVGECVGESARSLAEHGSWSQVAEATGTTKQAVWSRWRG